MSQRTVLTNWDPTAYTHLSGDQLIMQLVGAALKSGVVLIRDQDLSFNQQIASVFVKSSSDGERFDVYRNLVEELFDTGCFHVVRMRREHFRDPELEELAERRPIRARALYVHRNNLFAPSSYQEKFDPNEEPFVSFHHWIDGVLTRSSNQTIMIDHTPSANIPKMFRGELIAVLDACQGNLSRAWGLSQPTLELLRPLIKNNEKALKFLIDKKVVGARKFKDSPRRLLYAISGTEPFRKEEAALRRLAQSIFAAVYCDAEDADGLYTSRLIEPPVADEDHVEDIALGEIAELRRVQLPLRPGIGKALMAARSSPMFGHFITAMPFTPMMAQSALDHYADEFAKVYGRMPASPSILGEARAAFERNHGNILALAFSIDMLTIGSVKHATNFTRDAMEMLAIIDSIVHLGMGVASNKRTRRYAAALRAGMDQRCHRVKLLSA